MLHENLKELRKAKGLSQEELAEKVHVVRQTVSKWEQGLSVPDAELLILLAEALDTTVSALLGEPVKPEPPSALQEIAAKLELLNEQFARQQERKRKVWRVLSILAAVFALGALMIEIAVRIGLSAAQNTSIGVIGGADGPTAIFVSSAPLGFESLVVLTAVLILSVIGILRTRRQ